ncbi:MBL fold metallo-hydrolase [Hutsoniella sourekii]
MINQLQQNLYTFNVTLPNTALKQINAYVIKSEDRSLLIDTGYNLPESRSDLLAGLQELEIDLDQLDVFITHLHSDHTGLTPLFQDAGARIFCGQVDGQILEATLTSEFWQEMLEQYHQYGMSEIETNLDQNPLYALRPQEAVNYTYVNPGEVLSYGGYHLKIVDLPGHTPGHLGLYNPEDNWLLAGDTVLDPISPNITYWGSAHGDILGQYFQTLNHLAKQSLDLIYPAHRQIIHQPSQRIQELLAHHQQRLDEIFQAMKPGIDYTANELSASISWRVKFKSWDDFPVSQKYFAVGETMAHLVHLYTIGAIKCQDKQGVLYFSKPH